MKTAAATSMITWLLVASPIFALPQIAERASEVRVRGVPVTDQGDGHYRVSVDANGNPTVEFTPFSALNITKRDDGASGLVTKDLGKRAGVSCGNSNGNLADIQSADSCLGAKAGTGTSYTIHNNDFCYVNNVVAYLCNYQAETVSGTTVSDFFETVDTTCGESGNGFYRCTNGCGIQDLAVGRAVKGASFC